MKILFVLTALLLAVSVAEAEMYQWTAEDGSVTYKDTPPPVSKKRSKVKVYRDSDFVVATSEQPVAPPGSDKNAAKVPSQTAPAKKSASPALLRFISPTGAATANRPRAT